MFQYRTIKDLSYYASDLNKFASQVCGRDQTIMNIDMIQYKKDKNTMRIIEYKHSNEKITKAQVEVYEKLAAQLNNNSKIKFQILCVKGDYPFKKVKVYDFYSCDNYHLSKEQLINFLNFKK